MEEHDPDLGAGWPLVKEKPGLQGVLQTSELCYQLARPFEKGTLLVDFYHFYLSGRSYTIPISPLSGFEVISGAFLIPEGIMCSLDIPLIPAVEVLISFTGLSRHFWGFRLNFCSFQKVAGCSACGASGSPSTKVGAAVGRGVHYHNDRDGVTPSLPGEDLNSQS